MKVPVYFCASIPLQTIADALRAAGIHIRSDAGHRLVAEPIPPFLRKDVEGNLVRMPARIRKVSGR